MFMTITKMYIIFSHQICPLNQFQGKRNFCGFLVWREEGGVLLADRCLFFFCFSSSSWTLTYGETSVLVKLFWTWNWNFHYIFKFLEISKIMGFSGNFECSVTVDILLKTNSCHIPILKVKTLKIILLKFPKKISKNLT